MEAKHQFKYSYTGTELEEYSPVDITMEIPGDVTINQMLYNFESYLKACGFYFDGHLEFVDNESDWDKDILDDSEEYLNGDSFPQSMADTSASTDVSINGCCGLKVTSSPLEERREKFLKEWNEGIAKLDNELRAQREIAEKAYKSAEMCAEVAKNKWVHGMCNPKAK